MVTGAGLIPTASQFGARLIAGAWTSSITRSGALSWIEETSLESSTQVTVIPDSHLSSEQMSLRLTGSGSDTKTRTGPPCAWTDAGASAPSISGIDLNGCSPLCPQHLLARYRPLRGRVNVCWCLWIHYLVGKSGYPGDLPALGASAVELAAVGF